MKKSELKAEIKEYIVEILSEVDEATYVWKFAEAHAAACFYTGRMDEAKATYQEILNISKTQPQFFTPEDYKKIEMNGQFFR